MKDLDKGPVLELVDADSGTMPEGSTQAHFQVNFSNGQSRLDKPDMQALQQVAELMRLNPTALAEIEGHTDSSGSSGTNLRISLRRAEAVRNMLMSEHGVSPQRLRTRGLGQARPQYDNSTSHGRAQNRRVEILVRSETPLQGAEKMQAASDGKKQGISEPLGRCLVLCFHGVDMKSSLSISSEAFQRRIDDLLKDGYNFLTLEEFGRHMIENIPFQGRNVLVTFDDGWKSTMKAYSILKEHNLPFTLFLSTLYMGHPTGLCLSQDNIEELKTYPLVSFANHSHAHSKRLIAGYSHNGQYYINYVKKDIAKSKQRFKELIGKDTEYFAFPFGHWNLDYVAALEEAGFKYLFSVEGRTIETGMAAQNLTHIPRIGGHNLGMNQIAAYFQGVPPHVPKQADKKEAPLTEEPTVDVSLSTLPKGPAITSLLQGASVPKPYSKMDLNHPTTIQLAHRHPAQEPEQSESSARETMQEVAQASDQSAGQRAVKEPAIASVSNKPVAATPSPAQQHPALAHSEVTYTPVADVSPVSPPEPARKTAAGTSRIQGRYGERRTIREQPEVVQSLTPKSRTIEVVAVGDIMMGSTYPHNYLPPEDGNQLFSQVQNFFRGGDVVFGNLEGPMIDGGRPCKCGKGSSNCYEFRMPTRYVKHLTRAGFNAMSIANNHAHDFGQQGQMSTMDTLRKHDIEPVGGEAVGHLQIKGQRVAMVGFAHRGRNLAYPIQDIQAAKRIVSDLKRHNDLVIVSFHGGAEGSSAAEVADRTEFFCGENRGNVVQFARGVIDAGADMVLGHGPHVLRAMEIYKGKLIAYSLGNFLTYELFGTGGLCGQSVVLRATIDAATGKFIKGTLVPIKLTAKGLPRPDPSMAATAQVKNLTRRNLGFAKSAEAFSLFTPVE